MNVTALLNNPSGPADITADSNRTLKASNSFAQSDAARAFPPTALPTPSPERNLAAVQEYRAPTDSKVLWQSFKPRDSYSPSAPSSIHQETKTEARYVSQSEGASDWR